MNWEVVAADPASGADSYPAGGYLADPAASALPSTHSRHTVAAT